jgi:hypothetical protein
MGRGIWNPKNDISEISGKVILVTGGTSELRANTKNIIDERQETLVLVVSQF